jgi:2-methylcitrate dehydratase PrpD
VATFVAGRHAGPEFDDALGTARARLIAALTALQTPTATSELASRALASYGTPLRRVFAEATTLAAAARGDAPIVAAALASSELAGRGETDVIEAIAVGREVAARLERALSLDAPWNATAVVAGIGAAAAAARAMGLDVDAARHAIGLAATQAAGLGVVDGTPADALACGKAAADAVEAALLARHGFTAASASLEGRRGLAALMASNVDEAALCDDLGRRWISAER